MAKPDKATLKSEGEALKTVIAQARKKTLNFALLQGKDTMYLETHLKKNTGMLRKEAKKKGGGPKAAVGLMNVEGKKIIFSVEEEPPGTFPKLAKKFFMARGLPMQVAFRLPDGSMLEDSEGEPAATPAGASSTEPVATPIEKTKAKFTTLEAALASMQPTLGAKNKAALAQLLIQVRADVGSGDLAKAQTALKELQSAMAAVKAKQEKDKETLKAAATSLKDSGISAVQKEGLLKIALARPKAFEASLKALKAIDKGLKPLDCTPEGLAKAKKAADDEKAKFDLLTTAAKQAKAKFEEAKLAATKASAAADKASDTATKLLDSLNKVEVAVAKMTPEQLAAMTPEQKQSIADLKLKLKTAEAAEQAAEAERDKKEAERDKLEDKSEDAGLKADQSKPKLQAANKTLKDTQKGVADKKLLTDAMTNGVLSPDAPNPMSDADTATIANAYSVGSKFGASAINMVRTTDNRANIVDGVSRLTKGAQNEFKDSSGRAYGTPKSRESYATNALQTGAAVGGEHFKKMDAYIAAGGLNKPGPVTYPSPPTWENMANTRASHVGASMLDGAGKLDPASAKAKTAVADMSFHPTSMWNVQPDLIKHFNQMSGKMSDPAHKTKCQAALDGITTPPTSATGKGLVAKDVDKPAGSLTKDDAKQAVMGAMFTPLKQGPVGSCFATGPARAMQLQDPGSAMKGLAQIAVSGKLTSKGNSVPIKAVRNSSDPKLNKLPPADNQLLRSWEYTIATASAQITNAREKGKLKKSLFTDPKSMAGIAKLYPNAKWAEVRTKLEAAVKTNLTFRYNATAVIEKSADGSSTKGNFEIIDKTATGEASMLTTKEKFVAAITKMALTALGETKDTDIGKKIIAHCKSDAFINAICPDKYKPWELGGGGYSKSVAKALEGGNPKSEYVVPPPSQSQSKGARTKDVTVGLIKSFDGNTSGDDLTELSVSGIHGFNGLPNHPSLDKLKGGDTAAKVDKHLVKPGQKIAATKLKLGKAQMIFERQIREAEKWSLGDEGVNLIKTALALKPTGEVTPKELKALVDTAMAPLKALMTKQRVAKWKKKQTDAGKTVSDADLAKQKKAWDKAGDTSVNNAYDNEIIVQTAPPEFTIADTNWGKNRNHMFFVIIADPISGEPKLFKKEMPSGKLSAMEEKWTKAAWLQVK